MGFREFGRGRVPFRYERAECEEVERGFVGWRSESRIVEKGSSIIHRLDKGFKDKESCSHGLVYAPRPISLVGVSPLSRKDR